MFLSVSIKCLIIERQPINANLFLSNSIFTITAVSHIIRLRLDKPRDFILDLDGIDYSKFLVHPYQIFSVVSKFCMQI
jgi:hypothetical protein